MTALPLVARLRVRFPDAPARRLKTWLAAGRVHVNGAVVRDGRFPTGAGDVVTVGAATRLAFPAWLRLVHEDEALLVVDKPPGLLTIATDRERARTVQHLLRGYRGGQRPPRRPFVVHRLDRDTSGLLVFAKSAAAKRHLQAQFADRRAERLYTAIVERHLPADRGTLVSRLLQDRGLRVRSAPAGRPAVTHYRVLTRAPHATVVELRLGTGRRHQIRVQLAELGHPIVGDRRHGSARDPIRRLCLHASALGFVHPETGAWLRFRSPAPAGFRRAAGVDWES